MKNIPTLPKIDPATGEDLKLLTQREIELAIIGYMICVSDHIVPNTPQQGKILADMTQMIEDILNKRWTWNKSEIAKTSKSIDLSIPLFKLSSDSALEIFHLITLIVDASKKFHTKEDKESLI